MGNKCVITKFAHQLLVTSSACSRNIVYQHFKAISTNMWHYTLFNKWSFYVMFLQFGSVEGKENEICSGRTHIFNTKRKKITAIITFICMTETNFVLLKTFRSLWKFTIRTISKNAFWHTPLHHTTPHHQKGRRFTTR